MLVQAYGESPLDAETYDGLCRQVSEHLRAAPGFIAHLAGPAAGGWGITEVWESREAADAFYSGAIAPMMAAAGLPMPTIEFRPLHNVAIGRQG